MTWKDIVDYEGLYQVSDTGLVKSLSREWLSGKGTLRKKNETILKSKIDKSGYVCVNLCKDGFVKTHKVHRLVAKSFISNVYNLPLVMHKNDVRDDNRVSNLKWGTYKDNSVDMVSKSRQAKGNKIGISKLLESQVIDILNSFDNVNTLSIDYNVHKSTIINIKNGITWRHLSILM